MLNTKTGFQSQLKGYKGVIYTKCFGGMRQVPLIDITKIGQSTAFKTAKVKVNAGVQVGFISDSTTNNSHSDFYVVTYLGKKYALFHEAMVSPKTAALPILNPKSIGVYGKFDSLDDLADDILEGINNKKNYIDHETYQYLLHIMALYSSKARNMLDLSTEHEVEEQIKQNYDAWKKVIKMGKIGAQFGELLGPFWLASKKYTAKERQLINIEIPFEANYPLVDYFMTFKDPRGEFTKKYSAKSNVTAVANTVKFSTVYENLLKMRPISRQKSFLKKHKDSWLYKSIQLAYKLKQGGNLKIHEINSAIEAYLIEEGIAKPQENSVKFWAALSKDPVRSIELLNFFNDFMLHNVYYVTFDVKKNGIPEFYFSRNGLKAASCRLKALEGEQVGFDPEFGPSKPTDRT